MLLLSDGTLALWNTIARVTAFYLCYGRNLPQPIRPQWKVPLSSSKDTCQLLATWLLLPIYVLQGGSHALREVGFSLSGEVPQWIMASQLGGPSLFLTISVPLALAVPSRLIGTPVDVMVTHPGAAAVNTSRGGRICWCAGGLVGWYSSTRFVGEGGGV